MRKISRPNNAKGQTTTTSREIISRYRVHVPVFNNTKKKLKKEYTYNRLIYRFFIATTYEMNSSTTFFSPFAKKEHVYPLAQLVMKTLLEKHWFGNFFFTLSYKEIGVHETIHFLRH